MGDTGGAFELDLAPSEVQPVGARLEMGKPFGTGSRRTFLAGVTLAMPPSINHYWNARVVYSQKLGRHISVLYVGKDGKKYQQYIREWLLERKLWAHSPHPLGMKMLVCPGSHNRQDISNRIKVLEDALKNGGLYDDDSQIEILEVRRGPRLDPGCVMVYLAEILPDRNANLAWIKTPL